MNQKKLQELMLASGIKGRYAFPYGDNLDECMNKFADLIVRECIAINNLETIALDLPDYNLGVIEGYRRARENISLHFELE